MPVSRLPWARWPGRWSVATQTFVLQVLVGLIVVGIGISFMVWLLFQYFATREAQRVPPEYPLAVSQGERMPPEPRLQTAPREDLRELRASEDELLSTYGWVDRNAGIVRIPINEAMRLTLERGLPTRTGQKP